MAYRETHEINAGDLLLIGGSFFKVSEVREPRFASLPGAMLVGRFWRHGAGNWSTELPLTAIHGQKWDVMCDPRILALFP